MIITPKKIGNFIFFKLFLEPNMLDIAIKVYKGKYGATSSVVMAISEQCIVPWKIHICINKIENFAHFIYISFHKEKKFPHLIFETGLFNLLTLILIRQVGLSPFGSSTLNGFFLKIFLKIL
jgi:hypothetical protein